MPASTPGTPGKAWENPRSSQTMPTNSWDFLWIQGILKSVAIGAIVLIVEATASGAIIAGFFARMLARIGSRLAQQRLEP